MAGDEVIPLAGRRSASAWRAKGDAGPVDVIGVLVRPPAPSAVPAWRRHVYCSLYQGAAPPRWIFEVEELLPR